MLVRGVTLVGEGAQRPQVALLLHVQVCAPLLREWLMSFGVVATRPITPSPVAGIAMVCSSL
jgi:hypothetical protein